MELTKCKYLFNYCRSCLSYTNVESTRGILGWTGKNIDISTNDGQVAVYKAELSDQWQASLPLANHLQTSCGSRVVIF